MIHKIPFSLFALDESSYHPVLKAYINHVECNLIIDTGASRSVFDIHAFDVPFHESREGDKKLLPAGIIEGNIENKTGTITRFVAGDFVIENFEAIFISLNHVNSLYTQIENGPLISGLLGSDFLVKYHAVIDFNKKFLKIRH